MINNESAFTTTIAKSTDLNKDLAKPKKKDNEG